MFIAISVTSGKQARKLEILIDTKLMHNKLNKNNYLSICLDTQSKYQILDTYKLLDTYLGTQTINKRETNHTNNTIRTNF